MKIIFTGGGTAGHVTPCIALMKQLTNHELHYVGTNGIERQLVQSCGVDVTYHTIDAVKLQRKLTAKNLAIPFALAKSVRKCKQIVKKVAPDVVFSKGGYVGLPVVMASKLAHVPCLIHESDVTMGLANKVGRLVASKTLSAFACHKKATVVGSILREDIGKGDRIKGLATMGFDGKKPVLLVLGGSLGAQQLNNLVANCTQLKKQFDVFVICGNGKDAKGLKSAPYVDNITDLYAASDVALTRCGSTTLAELTKANVPFVGVPLVKNSRGEQIANGNYFAKQGCGVVLTNPTAKQLTNAVLTVYNNRDAYVTKQRRLAVDGRERVLDVILSYQNTPNKIATKKGSNPAH